MLCAHHKQAYQTHFASKTRLIQGMVLCPARLYDDNIALYGKRYFYYIWELPIFTLMGVCAGVLGGVFVKVHVICSRLRAKYVPASSPRRRLMEVTVVTHISYNHMMILRIAMPTFLGTLNLP